MRALRAALFLERSRFSKMRVHTLHFEPPRITNTSETPSTGEATDVGLRNPR
jgi:hypothetical protein